MECCSIHVHISPQYSLLIQVLIRSTSRLEFNKDYQCSTYNLRYHQATPSASYNVQYSFCTVPVPSDTIVMALFIFSYWVSRPFYGGPLPLKMATPCGKHYFFLLFKTSPSISYMVAEVSLWKNPDGESCINLLSSPSLTTTSSLGFILVFRGWN